MAKKPTPDLTHTEILCLAIRCVEHDIQRYVDAYENPEFVEYLTQDLARKLGVLKMLYHVETGTDYD